MGGFAWVTLATNDSYSLGALVLGHALKQAGTIGQLVVLVTPGITSPMRAKLSAVFNVVQDVNILDSNDEANLRLLQRPELGVTFTKLHCWRLTQFDKCVFLDADTLVLSNCDELFQREELSAAPDVGWPDCFNSGVFVFKPSNATYESLIKFALENGSFDGGDQGLLNLFYSDWAHKDISKHLPFIYNMCSVASYSYLPAFRQFGGQVKIVHFIGVTKPWLQYLDTETKQVQPAPGTEHLTQHLQLWWNIFCTQVHPELSPDMLSAAQKNSSDKRPDQSTFPINTSTDNQFTYPVVIPDPWLSYRKTDLDKPDESHNTNAHNNEDIFDLESEHILTIASTSHGDLDNAIFNVIETDTTDIDLESAIVTDELSADTPTKATNISLPDTMINTANLLPSSCCENITEDKPELLPDGNSQEGLASAFAQFTLGSRRSENQSALEDHLRRQCWEVGNIDYLGRDSFSNIWSKISETMAESQPATTSKEEQSVAQTGTTAVPPPKPISSSETTVCAKPDNVQILEVFSDNILKQGQPIPVALNSQALHTEGPPVTLKDILRPTQPAASIESAPACEKTPVPSPVAAEIKAAPICETKVTERSAPPVCEAKPAEIKSVYEAKPSVSAVLVGPVENVEKPGAILAEGVPIPAGLICAKPSIAPETLAPVCQQPETVCAKAAAVPICEKSATLCDKTAKVTEALAIEKAVTIPEQKVAPVPDVVPSSLSVVQSEIATNNVTPALVAAIPLGLAAKEEANSTAPVEVCLKPVPTPESLIAASSTPQPQEKEVSAPKALESPPPVVPIAEAVSTEKPQETKSETISSSPPTQDNGKNNKNIKKNNKNGKQEGKPQQQQQHSKGEKGKNNKPKPTSDITTIVAKTEEKLISPVPISEVPKAEPEVQPTEVSCPVLEKVEDNRKESSVPLPAEQKPIDEPVKVPDSPAPQDPKNKKNDKQKKDNAGDKKGDKSKEHQRPDHGNNNQDKKKGTDKQEKTDGKKEIVQKPEQQGQNKNCKKGNNSNKGDNKTKKDGDQKTDELKIESKPEQKVESKPELVPETKPITKPEPDPETRPKPEPKPEKKIEIKKGEEKVEPKPQQKSENSGKVGKDAKPDDKKKGGKEIKPQAASPPKEKAKDQSQKEPIVLTHVAAVPAPSPTALVPSQSPATPAPATELEMPKLAVDLQTVAAPPECTSLPAQQKEPSSNGKKEAAPTPPPRKGYNGSKKGKKK